MEFANTIAICLVLACGSGPPVRARIELPPEPYDPEVWQWVDPPTGGALGRYGVYRSEHYAPVLRELYGTGRPPRP